MLNLRRLNLPKTSKEERLGLMTRVIDFIQANCSPLDIIFVGSILEDRFDEVSDIDVVVVFDNIENADHARRHLYRLARPEGIQRSIEFICVDKPSYEQKSEIGGIFYTAKHNGFAASSKVE